MEMIESVINNPVVRLVVVAGSVCAALLGIAAFARNTFHKLGEVVDNTRAAGALLDAQLTTNHGTSLLDKVNQIAGNHAEAEQHWKGLEDSLLVSQDVAERRWTEMTARADDQDSRLAGIAADLADHRASVASTHTMIIGRLDTIEGKLP